jgi:hypothetical protein
MVCMVHGAWCILVEHRSLAYDRMRSANMRAEKEEKATLVYIREPVQRPASDTCTIPVSGIDGYMDHI